MLEKNDHGFLDPNPITELGPAGWPYLQNVWDYVSDYDQSLQFLPKSPAGAL